MDGRRRYRPCGSGAGVSPTHGARLARQRFEFDLRAARRLLAGLDPYSDPSVGPGLPYPFDAQFPYPIFAAIFAVPFTIFTPYVAGAIYVGVVSTVMAFAVTRGGWWRLTIFLSPCYFVAASVANWSPLLIATAFLPFLYPLAMVKPTLAAPVMVNFPSALGYLLCLAVLAISVLIFPSWIILWLHSLAGQEIGKYTLPILMGPTALVLIAAVWWRQRSARLLIMLASIPQHAFFYDQLLLWLLPKTWRQSLALSLAGWVAYFSWALYDPTFNPLLARSTQIPRLIWTAPMFYLPALILVLWQQSVRGKATPASHPGNSARLGSPSLVTAPLRVSSVAKLPPGRFASGGVRLLGSMLPEAVVIALAVVVRLAHVLSSPFPLGDGGLFLLMTQRLQADAYSIPNDVVYNGATIPFSYPPFGFFATSLLGLVSGAPTLTVMRYLPLALSCITVAVVWGVARSVLSGRLAPLAAAFAFGMLPLSYRYFIMGAGITRSPGLLFAILTVWLTYLLCKDKRPLLVAPLGIAAGLTLLSHPNAAWFAAYSSLLVMLFFCRDRRTLLGALAAGAIAILIAAPWLALTITRHGLMPFLSAAQSAGPGPPAWELLLTLQVTQEPLAPVLAVLSIAGVLVCARRGEWWLPAWLVAACLLDSRYSGTFAMVPLALLVGVSTMAIPSLLADRQGARRRRTFRLAVGSVAAWFGMLAALGSILPSAPLRALPAADLDAMHWIAGSTPVNAAFLVVAPAGASAGSESEWFPVIANRKSLGTYQGLEWLKHGPGPSSWERYDRLQSCGSRGLACLEAWARDTNTEFDYVFVRDTGTESLRASLSTSALFALVYRQSTCRSSQETRPSGRVLAAHHLKYERSGHSFYFSKPGVGCQGIN